MPVSIKIELIVLKDQRANANIRKRDCALTACTILRFENLHALSSTLWEPLLLSGYLLTLIVFPALTKGLAPSK